MQLYLPTVLLDYQPSIPQKYLPSSQIPHVAPANFPMPGQLNGNSQFSDGTNDIQRASLSGLKSKRMTYESLDEAKAGDPFALAKKKSMVDRSFSFRFSLTKESLQATDVEGNPLLHCLILNKQYLSYVDELLKWDTRFINTRDKEGNTALHLAVKLAVEGGEKKYIVKLLEYSPSIITFLTTNNKGLIPEQMNQSENKKRVQEIKEIFKKYKANKQYQEDLMRMGLTPSTAVKANAKQLQPLPPHDSINALKRKVHVLHLAIQRQHEITRGVAEREQKRTKREIDSESMFGLARSGDIKDFKRALKVFPKKHIIATDEKGNSLLHCLVLHKRSVKFVAVLLKEKVANEFINATNKEGNTPLHLAAKIDSVYLVRKLLRCGARKDIPNGNGLTAEQVSETRKIKAIILEHT